MAPLPGDPPASPRAFEALRASRSSRPHPPPPDRPRAFEAPPLANDHPRAFSAPPPVAGRPGALDSPQAVARPRPRTPSPTTFDSIPTPLREARVVDTQSTSPSPQSAATYQNSEETSQRRRVTMADVRSSRYNGSSVVAQGSDMRGRGMVDTPPRAYHVSDVQTLPRTRSVFHWPHDDIDDTVSWVRKTIEMHHAYSHMNTLAARKSDQKHRIFTVFILVLAGVATLLQQILDGYSTYAASIVVTVALLLVATLTSINNFLGYQKRGEQYMQARHLHTTAAQTGEIALAISLEAKRDGKDYDLTDVMGSLKDTQDTLSKSNVTLPAEVADMFPKYEAPWSVNMQPSAQTCWVCCGRRRKKLQAEGEV